MTTPNDPIDSLDHRQRKYAEAIASGHPESLALSHAGYDETSPTYRLLSGRLRNHPGVQALIAQIQEKSRPLETMTRAEAIDLLTRIVRSKPADAGLANPLCNVVATPSGPVAVFPDKVACLERLALLLGWEAPSEHITNVILEAGGEIPVRLSE